MKVLVTGINGFVGTHLRRELEDRGHQVIGLDVRSDRKDVLAVDITDKTAAAAAIRNVAPEAIIHLAGIAQVNFDNPGLIYAINTVGTMNLLSACIGTEIRFLFISSSQVYGNVSEKDQPITEDCPLQPVNHYGASKASAEMIVRAFSLENNVQSVIVRPFNHTGKGQSPNFVVAKIVGAFKEKKASIELGNIDTIRDFLDVRDVVKAYVSIIENFKPGEAYNISSGKGIRIADIIPMLTEITGHKPEILKKEFLKRKSEIRSVLGSSQKLESELGWRPVYDIHNTLNDMLS